MNKSLIVLPALLTIALAGYKPVKEASTPRIEDKSVSLVIYKSTEYTSPIYNNATAQVHILVEKVNIKGQRTAIWDKTLGSELLSQYPTLKDAIAQNIIVPNVNKKKEHLEVSYTLTYDSKGTQLQMQGDEVITESRNSVKIKI